MAVNARAYVLPPQQTQPSPYGLLSVAEPRGGADHWQLGVSWQDTCPTGGTTLEACYPSAPAITGAPGSFSKTANATRSNWGATPFSVYAEVDCSAPGFWDDQNSYATAALERVESWQVERAFWTGTAGGVQNAVLPHLAAMAAIIEQGAGYTTTLQLASTTVTGSALPPWAALGALEDALADCLLGIAGVIHVPNNLVPMLAAQGLIFRNGSKLQTHNGNWVVAGNGYPRTGPDGTDPGLYHGWMFATGPIFYYRGNVQLLTENGASLVRTNNTVKAIAERTYLLGYDCCLLAVPVSSSVFVTSVSA